MEKKINRGVIRTGETDIKVHLIDSFPNHPYHVFDDEDMTELAASIEANGLLNPIIVRSKADGRYELISGHRRKRAYEILKINKIRAIIVDVSDDEAIIMMVDSNCQRSKILPSEKAFSYKKTKYLVIDDHPQIISRSMYYAAQSEMARRNAQRSKSEDSISGRGRYSGKHALSELLVCAECGSHYRRKYHKKKDGAHYYWRCISRLENGDKYCSNSKGLEEELLKKTICEALSSVLAKRENGYEVLKSRMIYAAAGDEHSNELYVIEMAISDAMGRIDELTELAVKFKSNRDKYDAAIGECNEQLRVLREKKENILEQLNHNEKARKEMERIEKHLTEDMVVIPEFNDGFIRRMVTSIRVTQDNNLQICIKGGYEIMASFPCDKNAA